MMKAFRSNPVLCALLTTTMLWVGLDANAANSAIDTCVKNLHAKGVDRGAVIRYNSGFCYELENCTEVSDHLRWFDSGDADTYDPSRPKDFFKGYAITIPAKSGSIDDEIAVARAAADKACTACNADGKTRCLKQ